MNKLSGKYKVIGTSESPNCECCGKSNLKRSVVLESESGEIAIVGVICASKLLRQKHMGKAKKVSPDAILLTAKAAKTSDEWKMRNGYGAAAFEYVAA